MKSRRKKCRVCREWFRPANTLQRVCSPPCAIEFARRDEAKRMREENKRQKQQLKPLTKLCSETQRDVNRYIVARDRHKGCISCGTGEVTDAGHFFHAGSKYRTSRLRFDHRVIHGQCSKCNRYVGGGNLHGYIEGIRQRFGEKYLQELYELKEQADRGELEPLTKDEVREIAAQHRRWAREIERKAA